jgi:hypothetical protein
MLHSPSGRESGSHKPERAKGELILYMQYHNMIVFLDPNLSDLMSHICISL